MNEKERIEQITQSTNLIRDWSMNFLSNMGISDQFIKYINLIFLIAIVIILVYILQVVTRRVITLALERTSRVKRLSFLKYLINRKFPHYLAMIIPFSLIKGSIPIIFFDFPKTLTFVNKLADAYFVFYVLWLITAVLNAFSDMLSERESLKDKPLKSYFQVVKIFLYAIGIIILISILISEKPAVLLGGLGAASAILMLVFKDTIMGFVASIQLSGNDMVRIGDWITMPKFGADGDVFEINLTTVKIRNFDKTISYIPPYSLISESFQNWRGMQETGGRRIKRSVHIKQSSIRFIEDVKELEVFKRIQVISKYIDERYTEIKKHNEEIGADKSVAVNGRNLTNMGLFRSYIEGYLRDHPEVKQDMMIMVRQLDPTSKGVPLELYMFADTTVWAKYEGIIADIFDHILASMKYFDLEIFEDVSNPIGFQQPQAQVELKSVNKPNAE
ncbi:MAG: mechanosensitive ion channel [Dysgonamonadaceae bacterium]|nr:mechanosensitive ion channel [Dysgonamonadaceae bacterium]